MTTVRSVLTWAPRIAALAFALFLALLALDVFGEGLGVRDTLLALLLHLIPAAAVGAALAVSWRRARVGRRSSPASDCSSWSRAVGRGGWSPGRCCSSGPCF